MEPSLATCARALLPGMGLHLVFTTHELGDRWFSHLHAARGVAVISMAAAARMPDVSLAAFAAYEILLHALSLASPHYDMLALLHEEERACRTSSTPWDCVLRAARNSITGVSMPVSSTGPRPPWRHCSGRRASR